MLLNWLVLLLISFIVVLADEDLPSADSVPIGANISTSEEANASAGPSTTSPSKNAKKVKKEKKAKKKKEKKVKETKSQEDSGSRA